MRKDVQGLKKGSVLKLLSAGSMASLLVMSMGTMVAAQTPEVPLAITINGATQTIELTGTAATPGLHDVQLSTTVSGQAVTLPPVEYVVNAAGTSATVVTSSAPSALTESIPSNSATGPLEGISAKFAPTNGGSPTTENIPLSDYNSTNNTVTFDPPGNLQLGDYMLTMSYTFGGHPTDLVVANPVSYTATTLAVPGGITAVNTGAVSVAANATVGETFTVTDAAGNPIAGVPVLFNTTGSLSYADLSAVSGVTNANGQVSVQYTDPTANDKGTITAQVSGNASLTAAGGTITVVQAVPASVTTNLANGGNITADKPVTVDFTVLTSSGVAVPSAALAISLGGNLQSNGTLSTGTVTTNQQGEASVTYTPSEPAAGQTISGTVDAAVEGYAGVTGMTGTLTVVAQAPSSIDALSSSATMPAGGTTTPITFQVLDSSGKPLPNIPVTFSTELLSGGGLNKTSAVTNSSGDVSVTYSGATKAGLSGDIVATVAGTQLASASTSVLVVAGPASQLSIGSTTANEVVGGMYSATVTLQDQYGNPVSGNQTVEVYGSVFQPAPGGTAATFGSAAQASNSAMTSFNAGAGVSAPTSSNEVSLDFSNSGTATLYFSPEAATAAATDLVGVALPGSSGTVSSTQIDVSNAGATPYMVEANQSAATVTAGATDAITFTVESRDGNPVSGAAVTFGTSSSTGSMASASFDSTVGVTNASGQVTAYFSDTKAGQTGDVTAVASIGTTTATGSAGPLTVVAGTPASISASAPTLTSLTANTSTSVTFTVKDQFGNPVPDTRLADAMSSLGGVLQPSNFGFTNTAGQLTVTYTPNPYTTTGSGEIQVQSAANTSLTKMSQPISYTMPSALPTSDVSAAAATESGTANQANATAYVTYSGAPVSVSYAADIADFANLSAGGASIQTPEIAPAVSSGTNAYGSATSGDILAVWPSSGKPLNYVDLTQEIAPATSGQGQVGFQFIGTTGVSVYSVNSIGLPTAISSGTTSASLYVPIASLSSGTWSVVPENTMDQWVKVNGTYYQFNVQQP